MVVLLPRGRILCTRVPTTRSTTQNVKQYYSAYYGSFAEPNYKVNIQKLVYNIQKNKDIVRELKGCCIYIGRIKKKDKNLGCSKPCKWCTALVNIIEFKKVVYTTGDLNNPWVHEKPKNLTSNYVTLGVRCIEQGIYKFN